MCENTHRSCNESDFGRFFLLTIGVHQQCGVILNTGSATDNDNENDKEDAKEPASKGPIMFKGAVNSGFEIVVEEVKFFDTEAFFTSFVDKLIKPKFPELSDWNIELTGDTSLAFCPKLSFRSQ